MWRSDSYDAPHGEFAHIRANAAAAINSNPPVLSLRSASPSRAVRLIPLSFCSNRWMGLGHKVWSCGCDHVVVGTRESCNYAAVTCE